MELGDWLRSLGLEQYEATFRDHAIDDALLPTLTAEDLTDLGVTIIGHRRKLLNAIESLRAPALANQPVVDADLTIRRSERRQVTVMFCDLVDSTTLAANMDPEDLQKILSAYQKCVWETVRQFDGFVARFMGDGVLAYFGYPDAHEDDAERAVHAGLEVVRAISRLGSSVPLNVRIGIATGLVVAGDLMSGGKVQEHDIVGETPNVAARLQAIAAPNTVVIAEGTRNLLGNLFELHDLGTIELKGITRPIRAWVALRVGSAEGRFEALRPTELTTLIGRDKESALLQECWSKAKSGQGQVVLISGEAGIGKSRLTTVLMEQAVTEQHVRLRYFCSPQHTNSAFYPIIGQMERAARLAYDDPLKTKHDKLNALLTGTSTPIEDAALLAEMLSLPNDGRYLPIELPPQLRREKTLEALIAQIVRVSKRAPVLMIFEDAHWADPTSLEAISRFTERIASIPVLLVITFRSEFKSPWEEDPHVTSIILNRLEKCEAALMVAALTENKLLPADVQTEILDRCDGIPLFVEEMTKAVLEANGEAEARQTVAVIPSPVFSVPASLHASLMARLDRLGSAKRVAQVGAAIGRDFSHALLAAVVDSQESELAAAMERLVGAGLLLQQGVPPHVSYLFKHALVQDAAYGTLLREQRKELHARIAEVMETRFADIAERQPELLARHCGEAGLTEKAVRFWAKAGQRSLTRSALVEAVEQLSRALNHIESLPTTPALRNEQIKLQVALINPLIHTKGHAAPEVRAAVERSRLLIDQAEALGEPLEDPLLLFSVLYGLWASSFVSFDGERILELATQFSALAEKSGGTGPIIIGRRLLGLSLQHTGSLEEGRAHLDHGLALYDPGKHRSLGDRFGQDPRPSALSFRALASWLLGYPDAALRDLDEALRDARKLRQAGTMLYTLAVSSRTFVAAREYTKATSVARALITLAEEKGAALWKAFGVADQGCILVLTGKAPEGVELLTTGIAGIQSTGATYSLPLYLSYLSSGLADLGRFDDAWRHIRDAMEIVRRTKEKWCEANVYRVAGEIALRSPDRDVAKAELFLQQALTIAREHRARSWELRAAMSLARLWRDQGKAREAHDLLASTYGWFTEGFGTLDLKEAKQSLQELAA
jgi:class 3 adenylate cyclase/predicted ATPase